VGAVSDRELFRKNGQFPSMEKHAVGHRAHKLNESQITALTNTL
jgi:hypothetical protein